MHRGAAQRVLLRALLPQPVLDHEITDRAAQRDGARPSLSLLVDQDELLGAVGVQIAFLQRITQRLRAEVIVRLKVGAIPGLLRSDEQALAVEILDLHPDTITAALRAEVQQ